MRGELAFELALRLQDPQKHQQAGDRHSSIIFFHFSAVEGGVLNDLPFGLGRIGMHAGAHSKLSSCHLHTQSR
jgi:hypothetical protein